MMLLALCVAGSAHADGNSGIGINLPGTSQTYGQDSIRAGDLDCKNSIGGATPILDCSNNAFRKM